MFPSLTIDKFLLRQITPADHQRVFEGLSDSQVIKYYGTSYKTLEQTQAQMDWYEELLKQQTGIWWGICYCDKPTELIGAFGFTLFGFPRPRL